MTSPSPPRLFSPATPMASPTSPSPLMPAISTPPPMTPSSPAQPKSHLLSCPRISLLQRRISSALFLPLSATAFSGSILPENCELSSPQSLVLVVNNLTGPFAPRACQLARPRRARPRWQRPRWVPPHFHLELVRLALNPQPSREQPLGLDPGTGNAEP